MNRSGLLVPGMPSMGFLGLDALTQGGGVYSAEASALFARFTTPPTDARKALINDLIVGLKAAGVWSKLDILHLYAAADSQSARQNWVQNLYNASAVNSPTFAADRGYTSDGSSSNLTTTFTPSTAPSPKFVQDSASFGGYSRTNARANSAAMFGFGLSPVASYLNPWNSTIDNVSFGLNGAGYNAFPPGSAAGFFAATRIAAGSLDVSRNGAVLGTQTDASTGVPAQAFSILGLSGQFTTRQASAAFVGGGLTTGEVSALYSAINTYLTAVGGN